MDERREKVTGGANRKIQIRKARADSWTIARRNAFLDHLAATSNVTHAARAIGISPVHAHALRRRDAAFAAAWSAALEEGYENIEAQLLARAIGQDADPVRSGDPAAIPFDPDMALRILAARKGGAGTGRPRGPAGIKRVPLDQVEASLRRKLDALAKRLETIASRTQPLTQPVNQPGLEQPSTEQCLPPALVTLEAVPELC